MKDERVLAYLNLFAILGTLVQLCELDPEAAEMVGDKDMTVGITAADGLEAGLKFSRGTCSMLTEANGCDIWLSFSSYEKFNGMIDGTVTPIPKKGLLKAKFLTKNFTALTDRLTAYLQPDAALSTAEQAAKTSCSEEEFLRRRTSLMFHLIVSALAQVGNQDSIGRLSAGYIPDGIIKLEILGGPAGCIVAAGGRLSAHHIAPGTFTSYMSFDSMELALALFEGKVNALACIGQGKVRVGGLLPQVDNVNRILDRVSLYLA